MMRRKIRELEQKKPKTEDPISNDLNKRVQQLEVALAELKGECKIFLEALPAIQEHIEYSKRMSEMAKKKHGGIKD